MTLITSQTQPRQILQDQVANTEFLQQGVVTRPFLSSEQLSHLMLELEQLGSFGGTGFYDTAAAELKSAQREAIHNILCAAFAQGSADLLIDYEPVMSSYIVKGPGEDSQKEIHRDFRLLDESEFRAVCIWVPLVDVDERNGALAVIKGSHQVDTGPRSVPMTPRYSEDPLLDLTFADTETVPVAAGEAVVFDMALAHGSDLNHSNLPRRAVAVAYAPKLAPLSLYFCDPDDSVEELAVPHPDVFRQIDWRVRPDYLHSLGRISSDRPPVSSAEFLQQSRAISQASTTD
ncbi:unannotated protein [freshwater metagenome]|uniref:Unannotated protein n=1 Tax=freshwater metagenome TaxID=449393 RepID=A0A6J6CCZ0_9ZZZZ|nr:hypothetical protein [Actinomycetota bacterium]